MKISCLPCSLFGDVQSGKMTIRDWAEAAKRIGYDGIDISLLMITGHTQTYLDSVRRDLDSVGIPVIMATTYPDFTHPDPKQRLREADYLMRDIAICDQLGIRYLRVLAGQNHKGIGMEQGITLAAEYLRQTAAEAGKYNVKLVFENHAKPGAWDHVDFSYPIDIFYRVFDLLEGTDIRLNFDIGNVVAQNKDPLEVLERVIHRVETVHISEMKEYGSFAPVEIGTGVCPIREVVQRLTDYGFDGWYSIEESSGHGIAGIENAWKYIKNVEKTLVIQ